MLGRDLVCRVYYILKAVDHYDLTVVVYRGASDLGAREQGDLTLKLNRYGFGESEVVRDQNRRGVLVMLCLREQVSRYKLGIGCPVGYDHYLARAGDHVDIDQTEHLSFCLGNKGVTRSDDLVDLRNGLSTVSESGNSLRAADLKDAVNSGDPCRGENGGVDLTRAHRGRSYAELTATGKLCGYAVHQNGGGIRGSSARNVQTDSFDGGYLLTGNNTVLLAYNKAVFYLMRVEAANVFGCLLEYFDEFGLNQLHCLVKLSLADLYRRKLCLIESCGVIDECRISLFANGRDYLRNNSRNVCYGA